MTRSVPFVVVTTVVAPGVALVALVALGATGCLRLDAKVLDNAPPTASVEETDLVVTLGDSVTLDGSGADPDCKDPQAAGCVPLTFLWQQVNIAVPVALDNAATPTAVFLADDVGQFFFQLTVSDGLATSAPVVVGVEVQPDPGNHPPVAVASVDSDTVPNLSTVVLDGAASHDDEDGDQVVFHWRVVSPEDGAGVVLSPAAGDVARPSALFTQQGHYVFELVVTDSQGVDSLPATVSVTSENSPPEVTTEALRITQNKTEITLSAAAIDPDNDAVPTLRWTLVDFPAGGQVPVVVDNVTGDARFTPSQKTSSQNPALCSAGTHDCYVLEVVASDGGSASAPVQVFVASLNNQPTVSGNDGESQSVILKLRADGDDVDNDPLSFTWTQTSGPALTGGTVVNGQRVFTDADDGAPLEVLPVDTLGSADFSFDVVADDGDALSVPASVALHFDGLGHRPTLTLATGVVRALEGDPLFSENIADAVDPDDSDVVTIVWERDDLVSSPLFPALLSGRQPDVIAPAFSSLVASGSTTGVYRIHAEDGNPDHDTAEQLLTVVVAPNPTSQPGVWVSSSPFAADDDDCGGSLNPCATLAQAFARITVLEAAGVDEAELTLRLTTGAFPLQGPFAWPAGISLLGGADPDTFAATGERSVVDVDIPANSGITLSALVRGVVFSGVELAFHDKAASTATVGLACDDCDIQLVDSALTLSSSSTTAQAPLVALDARGASATLRFGDVDDPDAAGLDVAVVPQSPGNDQQMFAVKVRDGANAVVRNSSFDVTNNTFGSVAGCISVASASVDVSRSFFVTHGGGITQFGVSLTASSATVTNTMMRFGGGRASGVVVGSASQASVLYNSFEGPGVGDGGLIGINAQSTTVAVGNIVHGFTIGMSSSTGLPNVIIDNVFDLGHLAVSCDFAGNAQTGEDANVAPPNGCNRTSGIAWTGNTSVDCPVVDRAAGDLHLNRSVANPCIGTGNVNSAGGAAPLVDFDGDVRGPSIDRGADDAP